MGLIVEAEAAAPLRQGDILKDVVIYGTAADGDAPSPIEEVDYVLVLSRHCNAIRKPTLVVAAITEKAPEIFGALAGRSLEETRRLMASLRDGDGTPDRFYLGTIPGREPRRAFARLDLVSLIKVPEEADVRKGWVSVRRIGTLSQDHRRHLHTSLFLAFGREGFDDFAWWPDDDLKIVIAAGSREVSEAKAAQAARLSNFQAASAEDMKEKKLSGMKQESAKAAKRVEEAEEELKPYLDEWQRRRGNEDPLA